MNRGIKISPEELDRATKWAAGRQAKKFDHSDLVRELACAGSESQIFKRFAEREVGLCLAQDDSENFKKQANYLIAVCLAVGFNIGRHRSIQ